MQRHLWAQRSEQLVFLNRNSAHLAHYDSGSEVCQLDGVFLLNSRGKAQGQHRNHGISGAGHVEDLAGLRGSDEPLAGPDQGNSLLAQCGSHEIDVES